MTSSSSTPPDGPPPTLDFGGEEQAEQLVRILDQYLADLKAGRPTDRATLLAAHPNLADQLGACLAGLEFIQGVESTGPGAKGDVASVGSRTLGDFRIVREVGRGGMGAVYEAEQVSLGRRVALKVLRFGGVSDPEALDRFQREAETVARLHHTNIVPIFAVGAEHGVNFYAMQFIEGPSLAEVAAGAQGPLDSDDVTSWGLQAAEALTHAHDRNVIHRDVKPSNLLLDQERRIWLTDFGLARRLDDVTLSMTGALLGTPRYMSPEQASATRRQVDRRTDIYSLGATLYELLAGRPAFSGDTPHHVIQQILSTEPAPLRSLRPDLPRDLETVVMKCLSKDPDRRYVSARELADDLRACLERRPIKARRAGPVELATRWLRTQRQGVRITTYAVAATLVLVLGGLVGLRAYDQWRTSSLTLVTPTPPLTAELIDAAHEVVAATTVPTERPLTLRDGGYELRLSSLNQWSQTFETRLPRGESHRRTVNIDDQQLWMPTTTARWWSLVDDADGAALLLWSDEGVACEGGVPKRVRWKSTLKPGSVSALAEAPGLRWPWNDPSSGGSFVTGSTERVPQAAPRTVDLNGDGRGDFLVAARHQAILLALSGQDGSILWCAARGADVRTAPAAGTNPNQRSVHSTILGEPQIGADHDGDGVADIVITCADAGLEFQSYPAARLRSDLRAERWVELVSGATGRTLWKRSLAEDWFAIDDGAFVPEAFQWLIGRSHGYSSGMLGGDMTLRRQYIRHGRQRIQTNGQHVYVPEPARLIELQGQPRVVIVAGRHIAWLAPATGEVVEETTLDARPGRPGKWADLDADGTLDFLFAEKVSPQGATPGIVTFDKTRLVAWSGQRRQRLWSADLPAFFPWRETWTTPLPDWPLVADLDGDGSAEVISPDGSSSFAGTTTFVEVPWGEIAVRDGRTGETRWRRRIVSCDQQVNRLAVGPDVDGDGTRELFAASMANMPLKLHVEARSGKTGELVWLTSHAVRGDVSLSDRHVTEPVWWNAGEDGWPQWIVAVHNNHSSPMEADAIVVSARDGRVTRRRRQIGAVRSFDVDHDGIEDLVTYRPHDLAHPEDGGEVDCVRGVAQEAWNRLGLAGRPAADFDGDGVRDLLGDDSSGHTTATSGRTGRPLWSWSPGNGYRYEVRPLESESIFDRADAAADANTTWSDIDHDGTSDLLFWLPHHFGHTAAPLLGALSGRTGEVLWRATELSVCISDSVHGFRLVDVDGDQRPELVLAVAADIDYPQSRLAKTTDDLQSWLIVLSAQTGAVRWRTPLSPAFGSSAPTGATLPPPGTNASFLRSYGESVQTIATGDLDGDGRPDLLVPAVQTSATRLEMQAYRGQDGVLLWKRELPSDSEQNRVLLRQHLAKIADVDGDGRHEALVLERDESAAPQSSRGYVPRLCVLDGATGALRRRHDGPAIGLYGSEMNANGERRVSEIVLPRLPGGRLAPAFLCSTDKPRLIVAAKDERSQSFEFLEARSEGRLWCLDVDGDGVDELAFVHANQVRVVSPLDVAHPRWSAGTDESPFERILEVRRAPDGTAREIVALRRVGDGSVVGLDAATGRLAWVCAAPIPRDRRNYVLPDVVARLDLPEGAETQSAQNDVQHAGGTNAEKGSAAGESPLVLFQYGEVQHARTGALQAESPKSPWDASRTTAAVSRIGFPDAAPRGARTSFDRPAVDPRWGRNLPWVLYAGATLELPRFVARSALYGLLLIVVPFQYVAWFARRRRWSLRALLLAPALVGLLIVVSTTARLGAGETPVTERWGSGLAVAPLLVFAARLASWPVLGQWRRSLAWLGFLVLASGLLGAIQLASDLWMRPLEDSEYYDLEDWYFILDSGLYVTAFCALPGVPLLDWWRRRTGKDRADAGTRDAAS